MIRFFVILLGSFSLFLGLGFSSRVSADQDTLDFLYSPKLTLEHLQLFDGIKVHARNAEFEYAITLSEQLVSESEEQSNSQPITLGQVLINHGILHSASTDYAAALPLIVRGLEFMERRTNAFSSELINGVMAKAATELELGLYDDAEDTFRRAQHITHRHQGVYAEEQLPMVTYLTKTQLRSGNVLAADRQQLFSLRVAEQAYGPDSVEILPTLNRLGSYFSSRGGAIPVIAQSEVRLERDQLFRHALSMYHRSVSIIEQNFGDNDLRLVQPLRGLASARVLQVTSKRYAKDALLRSLSIVESNPDSDMTDHAQALVDLGDFYILSTEELAAEPYLRAWEMLQETPDTQRVANALFGAPVRLAPRDYQVIGLDRLPDAASPGDELFIDIEYGVMANGRTSEIQILEKNVPNEQLRMLRQKVRGSRFRPRILDGEILATAGLMLHQSYYVSRPSMSQRKPSEDKPRADESEPSEQAEPQLEASAQGHIKKDIKKDVKEETEQPVGELGNQPDTE
jgi:hypothetical protein